MKDPDTKTPRQPAQPAQHATPKAARRLAETVQDTETGNEDPGAELTERKGSSPSAPPTGRRTDR